MTIASGGKALYTLDTGILLVYARNNAMTARTEAQFGLLSAPTPPIYSVVSAGEIRSLASRLAWGTVRLANLARLLAVFGRVSLDEPGIIDAYVSIDVFSLRIGRRMGKNDLWIAATAAVMGTELLTADGDFDHLTPTFLNVIRIPAV